MSADTPEPAVAPEDVHTTDRLSLEHVPAGFVEVTWEALYGTVGQRDVVTSMKKPYPYACVFETRARRVEAVSVDYYPTKRQWPIARKYYLNPDDAAKWADMQKERHAKS